MGGQMDKCMDEWIGQQTEGWVDGWDGSMGRWICGWMDEWMDGWIGQWTDGQMVGWLDGWMNGWVGGGIDEQMDGWVVFSKGTHL